jgi:hypothetical protein
MTVGNKIMNRCIGFRSTAAISYAQIQYQHLQAVDSGIDANSALTVSEHQSKNSNLVLF